MICNMIIRINWFFRCIKVLCDDKVKFEKIEFKCGFLSLFWDIFLIFLVILNKKKMSLVK